MEAKCCNHKDRTAKFICQKCGFICEEEVANHINHVIIAISDTSRALCSLHEKLNMLSSNYDYYQSVKQSVIKLINNANSILSDAGHQCVLSIISNVVCPK